MRIQSIDINSIYGGISPTLNQGEEGSYLGACAIDPDIKINNRIGGSISPTSYSLTTSAVSGVNWFEKNDQNNNIYYYNRNGEFGFIDPLGNTTVVATIIGSSGNGLRYYNNYYYLATNSNIHRYGPMNGTPTLTENWWSSVAPKRNVFRINPVSPFDRAIIGIGTDTGIAQSIQEPTSITFRYVEFLMSVSGPTENLFINVSLQTDANGIPSGTKIASVDIPSFKIGFAGSPNEIAGYGSLIADLGEQTLVANTRYWFVVEVGAGWTLGTSWVNILRNGDVYSPGRLAMLQNGNWVLFAGSTDISIALYNSSLTANALGNEPYSTIGNYTLPNHTIHKHTDNNLYFVDFKHGQGTLNRIATGSSIYASDIMDFAVGDFITGDISGATATILVINQDIQSVFTGADFGGELVLVGVSGTFQNGEIIRAIGDKRARIAGTLKVGYSNTNSDEAVLRFASGEKPTSISSYGTDLVVGYETQNTAGLFFWDTFAGSFYRNISLPYPKLSALYSHNGDLYTFGGSDTLSLGRYIGGETIQEIFHCDHATLPLQGAITSYHNKIIFGSSQTYPASRGTIWAWGSKATVPQRLHAIGSNPEQISALIVENINGDLITSSNGLYRKASSGFNSIWRSRMFNISQPFTITSITFPFSGVLGTTTITAKIYYDNERTSDTHTLELDENSRSFTINPTRQGTTNFFIELTFSGNTFVAINFPIRISLSIEE